MTRARELGKLANTNTLTADNTNNFVGIASTQPTTRLDVVGVVSATSFSGDGSSLTGVASTDNIITGTAATFTNVVKVGTAITLDATSGIITAVNGFVGNVTGNATGLSGSPSINVTNITASGTLTYEDVTNVDSIGIVTARSGVKVVGGGVSITAGGLHVTAGITTVGGGLTLTDSVRAKFGTGGDLQIYHDGTNSTITNTTGDLYITDSGGNIYIQSKAGEQSIVAFADGAVDLYYDNSKKLETTSDGVTVTGTIDGQTELRTWLFG